MKTHIASVIGTDPKNIRINRTQSGIYIEVYDSLGGGAGGGKMAHYSIHVFTSRTANTKQGVIHVKNESKLGEHGYKIEIKRAPAYRMEIGDQFGDPSDITRQLGDAISDIIFSSTPLISSRASPISNGRSTPASGPKLGSTQSFSSLSSAGTPPRPSKPKGDATSPRKYGTLKGVKPYTGPPKKAGTGKGGGRRTRKHK